MTMERVVTINLNGNAYQLDESAYDVLRAYLQRATAVLANNPDKDEIVRDLEQAVADKASLYLSPGKSVVSKAEVERIIAEMGPVEGDEGAPEGASPRPDFNDRPRKRLYRLRDGAWIAGVSTGMSAYIDVDVAWIRTLWILAGIFTGGFAILVYIILMFVVPSANTSQEWAEAHGVAHTAQSLIDDAKRRYAEFEENGGVRGAWRDRKREWSEWRRNHGPFFHGPAPAAAAPVKPAGYFTRFFAGIVALIFGLVSAVLTIAFIIALFSLISTNMILGWAPPWDLPLWAALAILCVIFAAIIGPFAAIRRASYATVRGRPHDGDAWHAFGTILIVLVALGLAWTYWPEAREWMQDFPDSIDTPVIELNF